MCGSVGWFVWVRGVGGVCRRDFCGSGSRVVYKSVCVCKNKYAGYFECVDRLVAAILRVCERVHAGNSQDSRAPPLASLPNKSRDCSGHLFFHLLTRVGGAEEGGGS